MDLILDRAGVEELLDRMYHVEDSRDISRELTEIVLSHRSQPILREMAERWNTGRNSHSIYTPVGHEMINTILELYDPVKGSKMMNISILRGTAVARAELSNWKSCRDRTHQHIAATEGVAVADKHLRGLMNEL